MNATYVKKSTEFQGGLSFDIWSDPVLALWAPIAVYWIQCSLYEILMSLEIPFFEQYRIHTAEDRQKKNKVSFSKVLIMVALQHVVQLVLGFALMENFDPVEDEIRHQNSINNCTSILLYAFVKLGYTQTSAFTMANTMAVHYQNYLLPCIRFFIAM